MSFFEEMLSNEITDYVEHIVTPLTPYFLCDHFISTELNPNSIKYVDHALDIQANDLVKNDNYYEIKEYDIVFVQVDHFDFFYDKVLPYLIRRNIHIILFTGQYHYPAIENSEKAYNCLNCINILLWISQNPIYMNHVKYMSFPYGIEHHSVNKYMEFIKSNDPNNNNKTMKILHQYESIHIKTNVNSSRMILNSYININNRERLDYSVFLTNIINAEFVISTPGDRNDCFRHYEAIGLNTIPVSDISGGYIHIFEDNMIYSNLSEMVKMIQENKVNYEYKKPNRDILTIKYWKQKINEEIYKIKERIYNITQYRIL